MAGISSTWKFVDIPVRNFFLSKSVYSHKVHTHKGKGSKMTNLRFVDFFFNFCDKIKRMIYFFFKFTTVLVIICKNYKVK